MEKKIKISEEHGRYVQMLQFEADGLAILLKTLSEEGIYQKVNKEIFNTFLKEYNDAHLKFKMSLVELGLEYGVSGEFEVNFDSMEVTSHS